MSTATRIIVRLAIGLMLALALPATAAAHGSHPPPETSAPAAEKTGGATNGLVIGGVVAGMVALSGGLIFFKERQGRSATDAAQAGTVGAERDLAAREAKRRARSSW